MNKAKKTYIICVLLVLLIILSISTNPTKQDYLQYIEWEETPPSIQIERINFYVFSTYTPVVAHEHGMTHLGIFGDFYQISDGQFDYPWWLKLFN